MEQNVTPQPMKPWPYAMQGLGIGIFLSIIFIISLFTGIEALTYLLGLPVLGIVYLLLKIQGYELSGSDGLGLIPFVLLGTLILYPVAGYLIGLWIENRKQRTIK